MWGGDVQNSTAVHAQACFPVRYKIACQTNRQTIHALICHVKTTITYRSTPLGRVQRRMKMTEANTCGCGRSPTGKCCGWHNLSEQQYAEKKAQWEAKQAEKKAG